MFSICLIYVCFYTVMMTSNDISKRKIEDGISAPPGFVSLTSFTLKRKKSEEAGNLAGTEPEPIKASFQIADVEKLQKSVKQRPWILNDQLTNLEKPERKHLNTVIYLLRRLFLKFLLIYIWSFYDLIK